MAISITLSVLDFTLQEILTVNLVMVLSEEDAILIKSSVAACCVSVERDDSVPSIAF